MSYTKQQILDKCSEALKNINSFYAQDFVNYRGKTTDTGEYFTEVIAEFVIAHINEFKGIEHITRKESYKTESHKGEYSASSNRIEEITAMKIFNQCKDAPLDFIGTIIDYQTPLKNSRDDEAGKIDLLSDDGRQLIILELKKPDSEETMLRCVLEGYTYLKTVDKAKLLKDFGKDPDDYGLSASPLVLKNGEQWKEMQKDRPKLRELMKLLDSKPYYFSEKDGKFIVEDR